MLLGCATVVTFFLSEPEVRANLGEMIVRMIPVIVGTSLWLMAMLMAPAALGGFRWTFPLNLTLPLIHVVFVRATLVLVSRQGTSLEGLNERLQPLMAWERPDYLILTLSLQVAVCSILTLVPVLSKPR